ncbi:MAG: molybdenum cofactor guanylyltransferase [Candidatus Helarchaeota archaeon]
MKLTVGILCGGKSTRFGSEKGLALIGNIPMIKRIYSQVCDLSDDIIVLIKNNKLYEKYASILNNKVRILLDIKKDICSPVIGAYSCFKYAKYKYTLLLACDLPKIKVKVLKFLIENIKNYDAVIPRHPNGYIEPLHGIYHNKKSIEMIEIVFKERKNVRMMDFISKLKNVNYISTEEIRELDANLDIFYNVNTINDLKEMNKVNKQ